MRLKRGKIGNINKKLLASALAFTFTATSLVSCQTNKTDISYITNESGEIIGFNGVISLYDLANYSFVEVQKNENTEKYYTIACFKRDKEDNIVSINDIFTNEDLNSNVFNINVYSNVAEYLIIYNMSLSEYTEEDLREVLDIFIQNQVKENEKKIN